MTSEILSRTTRLVKYVTGARLLRSLAVEIQAITKICCDQLRTAEFPRNIGSFTFQQLRLLLQNKSNDDGS